MWARMLPLGRPTEDFVAAIMAADPTGNNSRVSENDLYFTLRNDVVLASELDVQCKLLMHIMEPPPLRDGASMYVRALLGHGDAQKGGGSSDMDDMYGEAGVPSQPAAASLTFEEFVAAGSRRGISRARAMASAPWHKTVCYQRATKGANEELIGMLFFEKFE